MKIVDPRSGDDCCHWHSMTGSSTSGFSLSGIHAAPTIDGKPLRVDTQASANTILQFRSIVLIKQNYALDFAARAITEIRNVSPEIFP